MKKVIQIKGTHCTACKSLIEDVGSEIPGVKSVSVDFKTGKTSVEYDSLAALTTFKKEVEKVGEYTVILS